MDETTEHRGQQPEPPQGKVIGAIDPAAVYAVTAALVAAGFPDQEINVVTAADLDAHDGPLEEGGPRGFVERFLLSLGEDLTAMEALRDAARSGDTLIGVPVAGDEAMHRAAGVLRDLGAHDITHFGRWTITSL